MLAGGPMADVAGVGRAPEFNEDGGMSEPISAEGVTANALTLRGRGAEVEGPRTSGDLLLLAPSRFASLLVLLHIVFEQRGFGEGGRRDGGQNGH